MLFRPQTAFLAALLVSIATLGAAFVAQFAFDLKPCILCLWQRVPYAVLIMVSIAALVLTRRAPVLTPAFLAVGAVLFLASAATAFFHTGVEQHWWRLEAGCQVIPLTATDPAAVLAQIMATPQAHCDEIAWKFVGLSITIWNTALSLGMAGYMALALLRNRKI